MGKPRCDGESVVLGVPCPRAHRAHRGGGRNGLQRVARRSPRRRRNERSPARHERNLLRSSDPLRGAERRGLPAQRGLRGSRNLHRHRHGYGRTVRHTVDVRCVQHDSGLLLVRGVHRNAARVLHGGEPAVLSALDRLRVDAERDGRRRQRSRRRVFEFRRRVHLERRLHGLRPLVREPLQRLPQRMRYSLSLERRLRRNDDRGRRHALLCAHRAESAASVHGPLRRNALARRDLRPPASRLASLGAAMYPLEPHRLHDASIDSRAPSGSRWTSSRAASTLVTAPRARKNPKLCRFFRASSR